ncbi:hypothetical protein OXX79_012184, partial [Metschnikowia pulcherrima]
MSERRVSEDLPSPKGQLAISKENDVDEDATAVSIGDEKPKKSGQNTEELAAENGSG